MFKKILVAFDGSNYSRQALEVGCALAKKFGGTVRVVTVIDTERVKALLFGYLIFIEPDIVERVKKLVHKTIEELRTRYPDLEITYNIREGHPLAEIMEEAKEWSPDILVIGAKGTTDIPHIRIGSIAEALIRQVDIPVLIVKGKKPVSL